MKCGAFGSLHAVIGPEHLPAVVYFDRFVWTVAGVRAGEGMMVQRVPILSENNVLERWSDAVNDLDDAVAIGHGKRSAGTEVVLRVNYYQYVLPGDLHFFPLRFLP